MQMDCEQNDSLEVSRNVHDVIKEMVRKCYGIHCAFLFTDVGMLLRQKLCILVSGTKQSYLYAGWEELGIRLNIHLDVIKCIKYNFVQEDPTSNLLLAYAQRDTASISELLEAIYDLKRYDIIIQIEPHVSQFCINVANVVVEKSVYSYISQRCPFVLKDLTKLYYPPKINNLKVVNECYVQKESKFVENSLRNSRRQKYDKTVMLTFTADGANAAKDFARILRQQKGKIGVLILEEQQAQLNLNPNSFILSCFYQVDYVIPIITETYLKTISSSKEVEMCTSVCDTDPTYVKYIYTLMLANYLKANCRNFKVRSLIPNDSLLTVLKHKIMAHPLFQIWFKTEDINVVADKILTGHF